MSDLEVLQARRKRKVLVWKTNHMHVPVAQPYVRTPCMQIVEPWNVDKDSRSIKDAL